MNGIDLALLVIINSEQTHVYMHVRCSMHSICMYKCDYVLLYVPIYVCVKVRSQHPMSWLLLSSLFLMCLLLECLRRQHLATVCTWRSENHLGNLVLSFHLYVDSRENWICATRVFTLCAASLAHYPPYFLKQGLSLVEGVFWW